MIFCNTRRGGGEGYGKRPYCPPFFWTPPLCHSFISHTFQGKTSIFDLSRSFVVCEDAMQPEIVHQEKATCSDDALSGHVALTHSALGQWANHNLEATSIF